MMPSDGTVMFVLLGMWTLTRHSWIHYTVCWILK